MPAKIFCCYAREDEALLNKLRAHLRPLQREGLIELWHDRDISAGAEWDREISEHLNAAQVILLLVSPDFMNSDYCYGVEMKRALERHARGAARVIPIILRHVYWQGAPFGQLQALPTDAKPITDPYWHNLDMGFFNVAEGIRKVVIELSTSPATTLPVTPAKPTKPDRGKREANKWQSFLKNGRRQVIVALTGLVILATVISGVFILNPSLTTLLWGSPGPVHTASSPTSTSPASCGFSDEFKQSSYDKRWQWIPGGNSTATIAPGSLSISAPVDQDLYQGNTSAPKLLQPIRGNFTVETLVDFTPSHTYQGAGILLWQDSKNFIRLEHGYGDFAAIAFEQEVNGHHQKIVGPFIKDSTIKIYAAAMRVKLRIQRNNTTVSAWWQDASGDTQWQLVGSTQASFNNSIMVGLAVVNKPQAPDPDNTRTPITAQFDYFRVTCDRT